MTGGALLRLLGAAMLLSGFLWALQGSGLLAWPAASPMVGSRPWIGWGAILALAGVAVLWASRRRP